MEHGGKRKGAGRKKGTPNKANAERQAEVASSGLTPLEYLLTVMRDENADQAVRIDAARAAGPYVHPRLANIELAGRDGKPIEVNVVRYSPAESVGPKTVPA